MSIDCNLLKIHVKGYGADKFQMMVKRICSTFIHFDESIEIYMVRECTAKHRPNGNKA